MKLKSILFIGVLAAANAQAAGKSTITFGKGDQLVTKAAKKHNFKQDIEAVNKAHESWKKAHLNSTLYACQRNAEKVATLARKVSDRLELAKKEAVGSAKSLEKTVSAAIGADATEVPDTLGADKVSALKAKAQQLSKAKAQADLLERLAGQVAHFYQYDMPKESAVDGDCVAEYRAAMRKGVKASLEYHEDTESLAMKLDKLAQAAEVAWRDAERTLYVAGK